MKTIAKYVLTNILGWSIKGSFPDIDKSVVIFAPHTSYWDGFYGKLYFMQLGIAYQFLAKKEFFKFPIKYFFRAFGAIPVYENSQYVDQVIEYFKNYKQLHLVISPEGQLAKTTHWKKGFYYMANRSNVPIVVGFIDYKKKELGIKGFLMDTSDSKETMRQVMDMYRDVSAKYMENFDLDKRYSS